MWKKAKNYCGKPKICKISESLIPENSSENEIDFRGLPPHLDGLVVSFDSKTQEHFDKRNQQLLTTLFEYAIGARQYLGDGLTDLQIQKTAPTNPIDDTY